MPLMILVLELLRQVTMHFRQSANAPALRPIITPS